MKVLVALAIVALLDEFGRRTRLRSDQNLRGPPPGSRPSEKELWGGSEPRHAVKSAVLVIDLFSPRRAHAQYDALMLQPSLSFA